MKLYYQDMRNTILENKMPHLCPQLHCKYPLPGLHTDPESAKTLPITKPETQHTPIKNCPTTDEKNNKYLHSETTNIRTYPSFLGPKISTSHIPRPQTSKHTSIPRPSAPMCTTIPTTDQYLAHLAMISDQTQQHSADTDHHIELNT